MGLFALLTTLGVALFLVVKASDYFVQFAAKIAKRFGVSEFVIGLTLVAIGTSLPELTNMIVSSIKGVNDLALGNILGSNMSDLGWSIGLCILFGTVHIVPKLYERENLLLFGSTVLFYVAALDGMITSLEGLMLFGGFLSYVIYITKLGEEFKHAIQPGELAHFIYHLSKVVALPFAIHRGLRNGYQKIILKWERDLLLDLLGILASCIVLVYAASMLVTSAVSLASILGVANSAVGATIVALGTTVPELTVSITSVRKGYVTMMIGNLIGSNITNILLIAGIGAVIQPIAIGSTILEFVLPALVASTALFCFTIGKEGKVSKLSGLLFIVVYIAFLAFMWIAHS